MLEFNFFFLKDFYEFAKGKQLTQSCFTRYYKELLPTNGDCDEFCKLLFNGKKKLKFNLLSAFK